MKRRFSPGKSPFSRGRRPFPASCRRCGRSPQPPSHLFSPGILAGNLDAATPGRMRVALWREWAGMLAGAAELGPLWRIVRNRHASLGLREEAGYPVLHLSPHGALAVDAGGTLALDFAAWHRAWATDTALAGRRLYAAEFEDARGEVFHKICLATEADPALFAAWVQVHQATGLEKGPGTEGAPADFHPPAPTGSLHLPGACLRGLLLSCAERDLPLRCAVLAPGIRQGGAFQILEAAETGGWLRLLGAGAALFVEAEPAALLRVEPRPVEGEASWRVSLIHPDGRRWLELAAGPDHLAAWNRLVAERLLHRPNTAP